jgi:hypothetical protein
MTQPLAPLPVYDPRHIAGLHALADRLAELRFVSPTAADLTRFAVPAADFNALVFEHGLSTGTLQRTGRRYARIDLTNNEMTADFVIYEALRS